MIKLTEKEASMFRGNLAGWSLVGSLASKYKSKKITVDGIKFDSKREAKRYGELRILQKAKEITGLQLQVTYPLVVNGILIAKYRADFVYSDNQSGALVVEDAKGFRTPAYSIKRKLMLALYKIKIKEV